MIDLHRLDLNLLKAFNALFDEKSVTKAAEKLAITQPAMSGTLVRLREHFGDPLFVRVQRGMEPTERASALAKPVKQILHDIEQLLQPAEFSPATAEQTIAIAATDYAMRAVILPFLTALRRQAPNIRLALHTINEQTAQSQLEKGELDFVLVTPDFTPPDVHHLDLYEENYVCIVREQHPLAAFDEITLDQFCQYDHALVSYTGGAFSGVTDRTLQNLNRTRRVMLSVQNFLILPDYLQTSDFIAVVPSRLVQGLPNIKTFTPPIAIPSFTKTLVWHERTHLSAVHKWIRALIKSVVEK